ncbi:amino acid adenylation domain-containing protein [Kitasatospora sp. GP82]|uniref:amino acid adenylation domain-containing protein n=1 Tax=Kitasatospora sp. GP82 TaxID=3035089 RepID=UPI002476AF73|nr:amino acid adenylation domain-containing protein [Kitasatospora sp. GP82]MDH6128356.1 amino acid adenylation domain-containing protein [Kitasatospora sp. GP82]
MTDVRLPRPEWNATALPFRRSATIPELVREAARRHPDRPALSASDGTVLTHAELDRWTDRLARLLHERGIGRGSYVALFSDRTPWAAAALLAVLKSGAAYVPIDPGWPQDRVLGLLDDLKVCCLVTGRSRLRTAQELRWEAPSVREVVCPDLPSTQTWAEILDREMVEEFFDFLSGEPDPLEAAGFNLRRSERPYRPADVADYRDHVARLALERVGHGADILEVGCGSGLIMEALAPTARRYTAVDPSAVAVGRNLRTAADAGFEIEGEVCFAHEVGTRVQGPFDLVIMASTVQFLPDMDYFLETLDSLLPLLRPGGAVLLADLIDPRIEDHAGLRIPPALLDRLPEVLPGIDRAEVRRRPASAFAGELAHRYDALLHVTETGVPSARDRRGRVRTGADIATRPATPLPAAVGADDIAYAIFTSGSTGRPKGVLVQHRPVVNLIEWVNRTYAVGPEDRLLAVASFCFDLSVYDIFGVLAAGGSVHVAGQPEIAEPETLIDLLESEPVTIWDSAPAALAMLTPFLPFRAARGRDSLRLVLLSGDWVPLSLPAEIQGAFPSAQVVALGGATECTVWSNHYPVGTVDPAWPSIPYGRPMDNARYYVLDAGLEPCPIGQVGDLYIAGECLALGYAGRPGLTAAAFRPDPWAPGPGGRMYRTGDRARWLEDGNLEFLGRLDDQVKIRGYRIELGEIQYAVNQCPGVRAAVVVAVDLPGGRDLVAFYVAPQGSPSPAEVQEHLRTRLPAHMIPARIVAVDAFPLRDTGKIDKAALVGAL